MEVKARMSKLEFILRRAWIVLRRSKINRDESHVLQEYSDGWGQYRTYLGAAKTLDEWLRIPNLEDSPDFYNVDGHISYQAFDSAGYYRKTLIEALTRYFPDARSVTEYGAGVGRNLLYLKRAMPQLDAYGYELCPLGVEMGRFAAEKFGIPVSYEQLDYLRAPQDRYVFPKTDVAFTMFSLEQLPRDCGVAIGNMLVIKLIVNVSL